MPMRDFAVFWLSEAVQEKDDVVDYIGSHNLLAALAVDEAINRQVGQLADFPYLGKKGRVEGTFELVISSTPYVVSYRLYGREVQILHLFHARRDWPPKIVDE
jgi:toxin ParE1/3/4